MNPYLAHQFLTNTISPDLFQIEDVCPDNACLYRSIANSLNYRTDLNVEEKLTKDNKIINDYKDIFELEDWGYCGDKQTKLAKLIQEEAYSWLVINQDNYYNESLNMKYKDLIEDTHDLSIEEYQIIYSYFAGDEIKVEVETSKLDKDGNSIMKEVLLDNRWGGLPEIVAISHLCEIPIIVYSSQKYDIKKNKIITGRIRNEKAEKGVRFKPYMIIGKEYFNKPPIILLWKKVKNGAHYMSLYLKDKDIKINESGFI